MYFINSFNNYLLRKYWWQCIKQRGPVLSWRLYPSRKEREISVTDIFILYPDNFHEGSKKG